MHKINPEKLLNSKWTAARVKNKEKHFIVTRLLRDDKEKVTACEIEAVITRNIMQLDWRELRDQTQWRQGWC